MEAENSRSKGLGKEFEGNGGQKLSSSSEHQINGLQFTSTKPDSFVVDMERFEKDINSNSRITKLQRNLSRKGSQMRSVEKKIPNPNAAVDNLIATSPRAVLHGAGTPEKAHGGCSGAGADHSAPVTNHRRRRQTHQKAKPWPRRQEIWVPAAVVGFLDT
nr:uncharacterized protein LOC109170087 isoform X2 [Ipomoea batatas]